MLYGVLLFGAACLATSWALPPCVCTRNYEPVCGSDGKTYGNQCQLNCAKSVNNQLTNAKLGRCEGPQNLCICTFEYSPVCGSDGRTYPNMCSLECEPSVRMLYQGQCTDEIKVAELKVPTCACTREKREMCGSDGKTYANPCLLNCATAQNPTLSVVKEGPCGRNIEERPLPEVCACTRDRRPVCGTDGNTYSNLCMLNCAAVTNPLLSMARDGECGSNAVDSVRPKVPGLCTCTREFNPVCGSDGQTYPSFCMMQCRNREAEVIHYGPCVSINNQDYYKMLSL